MSLVGQLRKLYISNLPWTIGSRELRQYFVGFNQVSNVRVIFDKDTGLSKGYGFITFACPKGVDAVLKVQHHFIEGSRIIIQPTN